MGNSAFSFISRLAQSLIWINRASSARRDRRMVIGTDFFTTSVGTNCTGRPPSVELCLSAEGEVVSDLVHQTQPSAGVSATLTVARLRWRRALTDLRSRLEGGADADDLRIVAVLSAVFVSDLALFVALFSL